MREFLVSKDHVDQRLDKYLSSLLPGASFSFLQKMLRKKNIVLNDKKAIGSAKLKESDVIKIYFKEETFEKFITVDTRIIEYEKLKEIDFSNIDVVFEDKNVLIVNKPFGTLSQKADKNDISINEISLSYLIDCGLDFDSYTSYKPSIVNRLDRNTGGLIIIAKNRQSAVSLSSDIKEKRIRRTYNCFVHGNIDIDKTVAAYYRKDEKTNTAYLNDNSKLEPVSTRLKTIAVSDDLSLLEAELNTGKSHQIRATCAYIGHPIVNDKKYGDAKKDRIALSSINKTLPGQYLFAKTIVFCDGKTIDIALPDEFVELGKKYGNMVI